MSGGLNKLFTDDPVLFLQNHAFNTQIHASLDAASSGLKTINLKNGEKSGQVEVTAKPSGSAHSHPLTAFWLANVAGKAETQSLAGAGDFLFTPALTGCRLVIDPAGPSVSHLDGGLSDKAMNSICSVKATGANQNVLRYWDNGAFYASVVVGFRRGGSWKFVAQSFNSGAAPPLVTKLI